MNAHALHIVFTGGGTAGHLFPGLAVARQLATAEATTRITFAGSGREFERRHVTQSGFEYVAFPCRPIPRRFGQLIRFLADNASGYRQARRLLKREAVHLVVGLGGYVSVPAARAAVGRGVPLVLLEQNATPGMATRWLARSATAVCAAMAQTRSALGNRCPVLVTGTPTRRQRGPAPSRLSKKRLLVLGGSGGARSINESVPRALYKVGSKLDGWQIVHQSGRSEEQSTQRLYKKLGLEATVRGFFDDVPQLLAATDLAISRAGGSTMAELAAAGVPAVLLPYPHAADDHQRHNAEVFSRAAGAITVDTRRLFGRLNDHLCEVLSELLSDEERRTQMSAVMRRLSHPEAAGEVAKLILGLLDRQSRPGRRTAA